MEGESEGGERERERKQLPIVLTTATQVGYFFFRARLLMDAI